MKTKNIILKLRTERGMSQDELARSEERRVGKEC